jgi:tryptophanyl-tRNA synthetase
METLTGKIILSGIQPSGALHLGNYLGAMKQWVALQERNEAYFCIVDLHAITAPYEPKELHERLLNAAAMYLACGLDPSKSVIFTQSDVPAHTELAWLLGTTTPLGELSRMTQFKEKSERQQGAESLGLFAYPVLQAADILLYQADLVPVGEDQIQHIELARDIARRFNNKFGEVFTIPKAHLNKDSARIMSLADSTKKMSKSDNARSYIALSDDPDSIRRKIMGAVTETKPVFSFTDSGPAVRNLLAVYQALSEEKTESIEKQFSGKGYKEFKEALAELIVEKLSPIRERYEEIRQDDATLRLTLAEGKGKAQIKANQTLGLAKQAMGLV